MRSKTHEGKFLSVARMDLSKAFDSLNHKIFDEKFDIIGFKTSSRLLIKDVLCHRENQVNVQNILLHLVELTRGVLNRTVLGLLLLNLYINDMHKYLDKETELIQTAGDTVVFTSNTSINIGKKIGKRNIKIN